MANTYQETAQLSVTIYRATLNGGLIGYYRTRAEARERAQLHAGRVPSTYNRIRVRRFLARDEQHARYLTGR